MFDVVKSTVKSLMLEDQILEKAYQLYLKSPSTELPSISLKRLADQTGESSLKCRNAIVEANRMGHFPNCELHP
ncbi:hypothetical protein DYY88_07865 [Leptolyngbya iicbica LK]|uniref:Uncharacterized protein n=2 Tax=Cyanophyceae TaxID=3028117 RepID=A0A4Q7E8M5_9CYAN|nr:hypothetical protein [Leptolyngbya sp. LK]RZM78709.1 hypothetical protein DYY88_07865 [Leptolyngbya sp. LK]